jgi:hypothetical protein
MSYKEILEEIEKMPIVEQSKLSSVLNERLVRNILPDLENSILETENAIKNNKLIDATVDELFDGLINED